MEKAWMKTDNIVLLGDLNCNLLRVNECSSFSDLQTKTRNLLHIFYVFNMQNVIKEATRITPSTETLIDVIATNKPELVRTTGVLPLGITDHSLVYATLRLKRKRPPPTVITVRNFKQFNTENFKADMEQTPFYIASVFDDMDDILWAWNQLFRGVCDSHAPLKEIKVRSVSSPWINNTIRLKMNRRFKLFKRAVETKDQNTWADYKRLRNEITSDLRKAKAAYFRDQLKKAKTTSAYWNVLSKATNPKVRKKIGPLKRDDNSLAVKDTEKASLMNCFFSTIAEKLNAGQLQASQPLTSPCSKPVPCISDINLSSLDIDRKITLLKNNKATAPDGISPKLLKLAGTAVVGPLTSLFMQSIRECRVYNNWKVARLTPVFKKDDPTVMSNYRPLSLLSVPSKILESCVADMIAKHVFSENEALVTDNQWAYRKGRSTELLLIHLTETWRRAIDNKLVVGAVFIDFQKAFDCVSHSILLHKLEHNFGITGNLLVWLRDYLSDREQYTVN